MAHNGDTSIVQAPLRVSPSDFDLSGATAPLPLPLPYDPDDKEQKYRYQQSGAFGLCSRPAFCIIAGAGVLLVFFAGAVLFGTGTAELSTFQKPDPSDDEEGPEDGGFSLGGVFEDILRTQQALAERSNAVQSLADCPAGQRLILSGTPLDDGVCARILYYPNVIDVDFMRPAQDPCADFYRYACGAFAEDARNLHSDATFSYLYAKNTERLYRLIQTDEDGRVGRFYRSCVLEQGEARGHERSREWLDLAAALLENPAAAATLEQRMALLASHDMLLPVRFSLELNPVSATTAVPTLIRAGLDQQTIGASRPLRVRRIRNVLEMVPGSVLVAEKTAEWAEMAADIEEAVEEAWASSESMLDQQQWSYGRYVQHMQHDGGGGGDELVRYDALRALLEPWFSLDAFLAAYDAEFHAQLTDSTPWWVMNREYMHNCARLLRGFSDEAWLSYFAYSLAASTLHDEGAGAESGELLYTYQHDYDPNHALPWFRPLRFAVREQLPASSQLRCIQLTQTYLPVLLDGMFVTNVREEMGDAQWEQARALALDTARQVQYELAHELRALETPAGHTAAEKVAAIDVTVAVPRLWDRDGRGLVQERDRLRIDAAGTFVDNVLRIRQFHQWLMMHDMRQSVIYNPSASNQASVLALDAHRLFDSLVHQVNAFYVPSLNAIVINAGILAPPVFSALYDPVSRFAKLGMILGHEMSHSIDLSGSNFDRFGSFHPWLSDDAAGRYAHNAQCFVDMYSTETVFGNAHDGEKTLNENIADVAGFRAAYNAMFEEYRNAQHAQHATLDAYKRQFFIAYAQLWCKCTDKEADQRYIETSVHSASQLRVNNVVSQHTDFAIVFQCPSSPSSPSSPSTHCTSIS